MIYLTPDDLTTGAYQQFITESSGGGANVLDNIEAKVIAQAKAYLAGRFDVAAIFQTGAVVRNEALADILTKIVLYRLFSRNSARNTPTDIKEDYTWAIKQLEGLSTGRVNIGLPVPLVPGTTQPVPAKPIWGNTTNPDHYL